MKIIKKHLKLIVFIITCIFIYMIYTNNSGIKNINYISLGDGFAKGINSYGEKNYGYSDYLSEYFNNKGKLNNYYSYTRDDIKIKDLYNDILINRKVSSKESLKHTLREANVLTISVGLNDLIYRKSIYFNNLGNREEKIIKNIIIDLDELINEIKKYYKYDIYLIGYYNYYPQKTVEKNLLDNLNIKYKEYAKNNDLIFIDNSNINNKLNLYLDNPKSYYPNIKGYEKIYKNIWMNLGNS